MNLPHPYPAGAQRNTCVTTNTRRSQEPNCPEIPDSSTCVRSNSVVRKIRTT